MLYYRLFSFLVIFLVAWLASFLFWKDKLIYWIILLSGLIAFFGIWLLIVTKQKQRLETFYYSLIGLLIVLSAEFLFIFLESLITKIALVAFSLFLFILYLNELFNQYFKKVIIQLEKLYIFFRLAALFVVFCLASCSYGLISFLNVNTLILVGPFGILILLLFRYHNFRTWDLKINPFYLALINVLLMGQLFIVISYLPLIYYLKGMILTISYFFINQAMVWYYQTARQPKQMVRYLSLSLLIIVLILLSSAWY